MLYAKSNDPVKADYIQNSIHNLYIIGRLIEKRFFVSFFSYLIEKENYLIKKISFSK